MIFGRKSSSEVLDLTKQDEVKYDYVEDVIMPKVLALEKEVQSNFPNDFKKIKEEYEKAFNAYDLSCKRHGDFLTVFITTQDQQYSTTINLAKTQTIRLINGHPPDMNGIVRYELTTTGYADGSYLYVYGKPTQAPETGAHEPRAVNYIDEKSSSEFIISHDDEPGPYRGSDRWTRIFHVDYLTKQAPRISEPDTIYFRGVEVKLFVPAGRGQMVLDKILSELEKGFTFNLSPDLVTSQTT